MLNENEVDGGALEGARSATSSRYWDYGSF